MGLYLIADAWGWLSLESWLAVLMTVVGLGLVIFVHELGHFAVAKMCGVKCDKFYVGFDVPIRIGWGRYSVRLPSTLWKKQWGETEYGIGIIPLGGYVKMLGQDDNPGRTAEAAAASRQAGAEGEPTDKLDPRSYLAQSVPERMAIISAGVVMNVIFAFVCVLVAIAYGLPFTPPVVAHTVPGQPAWRQDLQPRDRFAVINGLKKPRFEDIRQQLILHDRIDAVIERPGHGTIKITLNPDDEETKRRVMPMIGVGPQVSTTLDSDRAPVFPNTPAATLPAERGFLGGDEVVEVNGKPVRDSIDFDEILTRNSSKPLAITVKRTPADNPHASPQRVTIDVPPNPWRHLGVVMAMGPITAVQNDSPAAEAKSTKVSGGLKRGDRIMRIDSQAAGDPVTLPMRMQSREGKEVRIEIERPAATAGAALEKIEFTTRLSVPTWFVEETNPGGPVAWLSLGATFAVENRVTAVDSAAAKAGIAPGDEVVKAVLLPPPNPKTDVEKNEAKAISQWKPMEINAEKRNWPALLSDLQGRCPETRVRLTVAKGPATRDSVTRDVDLSWEASNEFFNPMRGLNFKQNQQILVVHSVGEAADFAWRETKDAMLTVYISLKKLSYGEVPADQLGGPLSIAAGAAMTAKKGFSTFLLFLTFISANLAVVNFLPIPVLDGGHMMFLILEGIFRRPVSEKIVVPLTYAGLFFILSLMIFVFGVDIHRFWPF